MSIPASFLISFFLFLQISIMNFGSSLHLFTWRSSRLTYSLFILNRRYSNKVLIFIRKNFNSVSQLLSSSESLRSIQTGSEQSRRFS